jgi:hypothetical protein
MINVKLFYFCMFQQHWCKLPEDGGYAETCSSKLILNYVMYRIVHLLVLVLIQFVIQLAIHGTKNMKVTRVMSNQKGSENCPLSSLWVCCLASCFCFVFSV